MNRKSIIYLFLFFILVSLVSAELDCTEDCILSGYIQGICRNSCTENEVLSTKITGCSLVGKSASLIIGTGAMDSYSDGDAYIGENTTNPKWVWLISGLRTVSTTDIANTNDTTQHTGPIIGIKNKFIANTIDPQEDIQAKAIGGSYCFPDNYICIKYNALNENDYGSYTIKYTTIDLSSFNSAWSSKPAILIRSYDHVEGITTQKDNYDIPVITTDILTDEIWIIYNNTDYVSLFYENINNQKQLIGYINLDSSSKDVNIADITYKNKKRYIKLDLRGDIGTADNVRLALDISGDEGPVATDGTDDIIIKLSHGENSNFDGVGATPNTAVASDLQWGSSNLEIGTKDEDHMTYYGIKILNPKLNLESNQILLEIPKKQVEAEILITGTATQTESTKGKTEVKMEGIQVPKLASEVSNPNSYNLIVAGGPCINPLVKEVFGISCDEWNSNYKAGEAVIKLMQNGNKEALLIAGTEPEDTKMACDVITNYLLFLPSFDARSIKITKATNESHGVKIETLTASTTDMNLKKYPKPFLLNQKFNDILAVSGDNAKIQDSSCALNILLNLRELTNETKISITNNTATITGNLTEYIPLGNNLAGVNFFSNPITQNELEILQKGDIKLRDKGYIFHDELIFYQNGPSIQTSLSSQEDDYKTNSYMELEEGRLRYYYAFDEGIDLSKITASNPLEIKFLDRYFTITNVPNSNKFATQIAKEYYMEVGDSIIVNGKNITLLNVDNNYKVILDINGTSIIAPYRITQLSDGIQIKNQETFYTSGGKCCCFDLFSLLKPK